MITLALSNIYRLLIIFTLVNLLRKIAQLLLYIIVWGKRSDVDFIKQSIGIFFRKKKYKSGWDTHLKNSSDFVYNNLIGASRKYDAITILGSGRLYDFPTGLECKNFICVDRDPLSIFSYPNKKTKNSSLILYDVSSLLDIWIVSLVQTNHSSIDDFLIHLKNIQIEHKLLSKNFCFKSKLTVSLNLISQIPVYWQDQVFRIIEGKFGTTHSQVNDQTESIILSLYPSCQYLIENHLKLLLNKNSNLKGIKIVIGDLSYIEGKNLNISTSDKNIFDDSSISINAKSKNEKVFLQDALFGVDIKKLLQTLNQKPRDTKQWIWKISNSNENKTSSYHRVIALACSEKAV